MNKAVNLFFPMLVCVILLTPQSESAKILAVFPCPSYSHQVVFRPLTHELARRGHEVTILTPDPAFTKGNTPPNITELDFHDISYKVWRSGLAEAMKGDQDIIVLMRFFVTVLLDISDVQFKSSEVQKLLNETKKFDLIIVEAGMQTPLLFSHIYKAPVIQIGSLGLAVDKNNDLGIPTHPILYPHYMTKITITPTIWERVKELYDFFRLMQFMYGEGTRIFDAKMKESFGPDIPSVNELKKNIDLTFLNIHPMWQSNVPQPPNVVNVWGIYSKPRKELPEDIKSYLDSSKQGVIYMSFGTNAMPSALPSDKIQAFVKVFSELPYDVIWKWEKDELPGRTDNIRIGKWFPQSDLLRHPKIKLFITQGGLQSTQEAIDAGVPLVGVPLLGDQWYNVEKYVKFEIGEKLDIETLTVDHVREAVTKVLNNDSYREKIIKLRDVMRDEPQSALERAVWWTEYVLRHKGAKHLRAAGANLSWTEYYEIPLVFMVVFSVLVASACVFLVMFFVVKKVLLSSYKLKQN